jgi:hypothetical protein
MTKSPEPSVRLRHPQDVRNIRSRCVANAFFASIDYDAQTDVVDALEAGDVKNALCLLEQVSNNLGAARDILNNRMLYLNINADPGATSKQNSFDNDILRNKFTQGVVDR